MRTLLLSWLLGCILTYFCVKNINIKGTKNKQKFFWILCFYSIKSCKSKKRLRTNALVVQRMFQRQTETEGENNVKTRKRRRPTSGGRRRNNLERRTKS